MAMSGVVAVAEPAFWAGFDRLYRETFIDYFRQISEFEPTRACAVRHPPLLLGGGEPEGGGESELQLREVLKHFPELFANPTVVGVGVDGARTNRRRTRSSRSKRTSIWR
jgi:predicted metal-dependent TIM-barrel fold hydrolase